MVGSNETLFAWMDEAWAMFILIDFIEKVLPSDDPRAYNLSRYNANGGIETELPPMIPSTNLRAQAYGMANYTRASIAFDLLRDYLGKDKFKSILQVYINTWDRKHPTPYDFFNTFNSINGTSLNWFWEPWFFKIGNPDLGVKINNGKIIVENVGAYPVPIKLQVFYKDDSSENLSLPIDTWANGKNEHIINVNNKKQISKIVIGHKNIHDVDKSNNEFTP